MTARRDGRRTLLPTVEKNQTALLAGGVSAAAPRRRLNPTVLPLSVKVARAVQSSMGCQCTPALGNSPGGNQAASAQEAQQPPDAMSLVRCWSAMGTSPSTLSRCRGLEHRDRDEHVLSIKDCHFCWWRSWSAVGRLVGGGLCVRCLSTVGGGRSAVGVRAKAVRVVAIRNYGCYLSYRYMPSVTKSANAGSNSYISLLSVTN